MADRRLKTYHSTPSLRRYSDPTLLSGSSVLSDLFNTQSANTQVGTPKEIHPKRFGTVWPEPERVLPETRRLPLMVEEEVRAFEFWSVTENFRWASNAPGKMKIRTLIIYYNVIL